jgi:hypothetical protein
MSRGNDDALHHYQGSRARCTSQRFSIGGFLQISPAPTMRTAVVVAAIAAFVGVADAFSSAAITPNTKLPAVNLHYGFPPVLVNLAPYAGGKTMIIVGLPGAVRLFWAVMRWHFSYVSFWYSFFPALINSSCHRCAFLLQFTPTCVSKKSCERQHTHKASPLRD